MIMNRDSEFAVRQEQLAVLFRHAPLVLAANFVLPVLVAFVLWPVVGHELMMAWLFAIYMLTIARTVLVMYYFRHGEPAPDINFWAWAFVTGSAISGCLWGSTGVLFFTPEHILHLCFVLIVLVGLAAGSSASLASFLPAYYSFAIPLITPFGIRSLLEGGETFVTIGIMVFLFLAVSLGFGRNISATIVGSIRLRFENVELLQRLQQISYQDALTGIANRRRFDEYLALELQRAQRDGIPLSLILLDVDFFKAFNDNYGHAAGDQVLRQIARAMSTNLYRPADLVARFGGEEFAVVLPGTGITEAAEIAERLRMAVAALGIRHAHSQIASHVTASMGVAGAGARSATILEELIARTDQALYQAKNTGRNRVVVVSDDEAEDRQQAAQGTLL